MRVSSACSDDEVLLLQLTMVGWGEICDVGGVGDGLGEGGGGGVPARWWTIRAAAAAAAAAAADSAGDGEGGAGDGDAAAAAGGNPAAAPTAAAFPHPCTALRWAVMLSFLLNFFEQTVQG